MNPPDFKSVLSASGLCGWIEVMEHDYTNPRLYVKDPIKTGACIVLPEGPTHYLKNVLRVTAGDPVRIFDGISGEFLARVEEISKKSANVRVEKMIRAQPDPRPLVHLIFPPLKKEALDFLIEKGTELGVDVFHPVLTAQSDVRAVNPERLTAQMVEAAEQCERLTIPVLEELTSLDRVLASWPADRVIYAAIEREGKAVAPARAAHDLAQDYAVLIGPAGGWRAEEKAMFKRFSFIRSVTLGENILRAETAALAMLAAFKFLKEK